MWWIWRECNLWSFRVWGKGTKWTNFKQLLLKTLFEFGKNQSSIWNLVPLCLMWSIWRERNARTFEDMSRSADQLLELFVTSLYDWSRIGGLTTTNSVSEFVVSLHLVSCLFWCNCFSLKCTLCALWGAFLIQVLLSIKKKKLYLSGCRLQDIFHVQLFLEFLDLCSFQG